MIQSPQFWLWIFASALLYWLVPVRFRPVFLGSASLGYLATVQPAGVVVLCLWTAAFYWLPRRSAAGRMSRTTLWLILAVFGYLAWFKYIPKLLSVTGLSPAAAHVALPLGISYFTFKFVHYAMELNRGNLPRHSFSEFMAYIFLVPTFSAGPIDRFDRFLANREPAWQWHSTVDGLTRIVQGLVKKFFLADMLLASCFGKYTSVSLLVAELDQVSAWMVWGWFFLSFLSVYLDFSAYSDIAIGSARLFGLTVTENFRWPILATNIGAFWRRWHMSLSGWCQTYAYLPCIGAARNPYFATYATFVVIGLWHSGSLGWLAWGLYHATGICTFVVWSHWKKRRRWTAFDSLPGRMAGFGLTQSFVSAGGVLTALDAAGQLGAIPRVYLKMLCLY